MHYVERHWCCGGPVDKHTLEGRSCSVYLMHLNINSLHPIKGNYRSAQVRKKIYYTCDVLFWSLNLHSAHMSWLTVWLFDCKVLLWESKIWCLFSLQPTKWSHHTSMWNMKDIETLGAWWLICQQPLLSLKSPYIHLPLVKTRVLFFFNIRLIPAGFTGGRCWVTNLQRLCAQRAQLWTRGGRSAVLSTHSRFKSSRFWSFWRTVIN